MNREAKCSELHREHYAEVGTVGIYASGINSLLIILAQVPTYN